MQLLLALVAPVFAARRIGQQLHKINTAHLTKGAIVMFTARYTAYAAAHGMSAEQMQEHDRFFYPTACAMNFMLWAQEKLKQYRKETGFTRFASEKDHAKYDEWLKQFSVDERTNVL